MDFWLIALATAALISIAFFFALKVQAPLDDAHVDLQVYKDQLKEIDRDLERGVISEQEAQRVRTEVSRRILSLDASTPKSVIGNLSRPYTYALSTLLAIVLMGGSYALYSRMGAPGYPDLPLQARKDRAQESLENRPSQTDFIARLPATEPVPLPEGKYGELITKLREAVAANPDDLQGHVLLARTEASLENFEAAAKVQGRVLSIKGDAATADDYFDYADALILAANGYVSPEAEAALQAVLSRDNDNGAARYYLGLMMAQNGRPDFTFRVWNELLRKSDPQDPWMPPLRAQIEEIAALAGQTNFSLPPESGGLRGPNAEDVAAASDMSAEDRQEMVQNMVAQLSERLATEGGSSAEWARLINALSVMGDKEKAKTILAEARQIFGKSPKDLSAIEAAAKQAGLKE